jgi:hypothetical protein
MRPMNHATATGSRSRTIALYAIAVLVVAGTATAFVQSYEGLFGWASRYLSPAWARTWPLQVDAWIAVGELALYVGYRDGWPARRKIWPWVAALTGLAASTGFNVGHLAATDLPGRLTAAVPPIAAFGGLYLGLQVLKHIEDTNDVIRQRQGIPMPQALNLAAAVVAADRMYNRTAVLVAESNGARALPAQDASPNGHPHDDGQPEVTDPEALAQQLLSQKPGITGAELARRIGVPERTGSRILQRIAKTNQT